MCMVKKKRFILVPAMTLAVLLLATTPLKLVNKAAHASPCPHSQNKQVLLHNRCFSPSLVSQYDFDSAIADTESRYPEKSYGGTAFHFPHDSFHFKIDIRSMPLRC